MLTKAARLAAWLSKLVAQPPWLPWYVVKYRSGTAHLSKVLTVNQHEACRALQAGDIDGAVVGGTSLILTPHMYAMMASDGILSPEGSCKTFDASADGFARAEAINAIYLRRLDDAVRNGYPIRAVIRGTGVNTNGFNTDGLISPDTASQAALIRDVYESAALDPSETPYIEVYTPSKLTKIPLTVIQVPRYRHVAR